MTFTPEVSDSVARGLTAGGTWLFLVGVWVTGLCMGMGLVLTLMKYASSLPADQAELR